MRAGTELASTAVLRRRAVEAEHGGSPLKAAISPDKAAALIPDGASVLVGGFMGVGSPHRLIDAL